jgi:hypothetical protein
MSLRHPSNKSSNVLSYRHNRILYLVVFKTYENHNTIFQEVKNIYTLNVLTAKMYGHI